MTHARTPPRPTAVPWLASSGVVQALDYLAGDGTDETHLLRRMMRHAAGRTVHFAAPPVSYRVSGDVPVFAGTTVTGVGVASLFEQTGDMMPLFDCSEAPGCTIADLKAIYTGPTGNEGASMRGGSAAATHAVVWTNADGGTFQRITSEDFGSPVRVDNWDEGGGRTASPSGITVEDLTMTRPVFGLLIEGCTDSTFTRITGYDPQNLTGDPPHVVYVTGASPTQTGLVFSDLHGEGCESSAFQFKGMLGGSVTNMTAFDCQSIFTALHCDGTTFTTGTGTAMRSGPAYSGIYAEDVANASISAMTLRYAAGMGGTALAPHRGPVVIGDGNTIDGLDLEFPLADNADAAAIWFGNAQNNTTGYTVTNLRAVNTGTQGQGHAAKIRNVPSGFSLTVATLSGFGDSYDPVGTTAGVGWAP